MDCHGCARTGTVHTVMLALVWAAMRLRPRLFPHRPAAGPSPALEAVHAR